MDMFRAASTAFILALVALGGCQQLGRLSQEPTAVSEQPQGVEGDWMGADGVAVSSLHDGRFQSRSVQTGEMLTEGSYTHQNLQTISLAFFSVKNDRPTVATCALVDANRMNCTLASGKRFVLDRHHA